MGSGPECRFCARILLTAPNPGGCVGRTPDKNIALFKPLGMGIEDPAAAEYLHGRAREENVGKWLEWV